MVSPSWGEPEATALLQPQQQPQQQPQHPPQLQWRRRTRAVAAAACTVGLVIGAVANSSFGSSSTNHQMDMAASTAKTTAGMTAAKSYAPTFKAHRDGYDQMKDETLRLYRAWDMIIEPNCKMVFEIENFDASNTYIWNVSVTPDEAVPSFGEEGLFYLKAQERAAFEIIKNEDELHVKFSGVNTYYRVAVTMYNSENPDGLQHSVDGVTKFVRREIRTLTDADRNKYFDALQIVFNTSQEEGQAKYGDDFASHAHFTGLHDSADYIYHGNLFFINSHPTMQLKLEKSLATVYSDVSYPYWDFLLDSDLGENWTQSILYSDDWFGPADTYAEDDYRLRGRFRDTKKIVDIDHTMFPEAGHSPYGFVSWVTDYNKQGYLQRTDKVCDFAMTSAYSKCDAVSHCFGNYTTLYDFDICMESNVHGNLHSMHAGLFDCEVSWKTWYEENTWISKNRLSFFAVQMEKLMYDVQEDLYVDYLNCPTRCDMETDNYDTCRCTPNATYGWSTPEDMEENLSEGDIRGLLQTWYEVAYDTGPFGQEFIETYGDNPFETYYKPKQGDENSTDYIDDKNMAKLELLLLQTIIFSGNQGVMASGASANDPIFWVFHQIFDKAIQVLRLSPEYSSYNMTWNNNVQGAGDRWLGASAEESSEGLYSTPFQAEIFEPSLGGKIDADTYLNNKELWELLKPDANSLSYVYDDFTSWGSCSFDPFGSNSSSPY